MRDEGNIAGRQATTPRLNDGLILLEPSRGGKIARTLFHIRSPSTSRAGSTCRVAVQLAIEVEFRGAHFCGRDRYEADLLGRSVAVAPSEKAKGQFRRRLKL